MALERFSMVRLITDQYEKDGIPLGSVGVILDTYENGDYEVEFIRGDGSTIDWFAVKSDEVEQFSKA